MDSSRHFFRKFCTETGLHRSASILYPQPTPGTGLNLSDIQYRRPMLFTGIVGNLRGRHHYYNPIACTSLVCECGVAPRWTTDRRTAMSYLTRYQWRPIVARFT